MYVLLLVVLTANGHLNITMQDFEYSKSCNNAVNLINDTYAKAFKLDEIKLLACIPK